MNKGRYNTNWHAHNVFYDNSGHEHHGKPYNGKLILANPEQFYGELLDGDTELGSMELQEVTPNDAQEGRTGGDDYLNTVSQIQMPTRTATPTTSTTRQTSPRPVSTSSSILRSLSQSDRARRNETAGGSQDRTTTN